MKFIIALLPYLSAKESSEAFLVMLTKPTTVCGDYLRTSKKTSQEFELEYEPLRATYTRETVTLARADVAFTAQKFSFQQRMNGNLVTSGKFRRSLAEPDPSAIDHVVVPYDTPTVKGRVNFIIPFIETPSTDCFNWPELLDRANNTAKGLLTFATEGKERTFYYIGEAIMCNREAIKHSMGLVKNEANFFNLSNIIYPLNINCRMHGVDSKAVFVNDAGTNYCFWILFSTILFCGLYAVIADGESLIKPTADKNILTHHPLYSLHYASSSHYPRSARAMLLVAAWSAIVAFHSLFAWTAPQIHVLWRIAGLSPLAAIFAFPFEVCVGFLLARAYVTNAAFVEQMRVNESVEERLKSQEEWQCDQYRAYFMFYTITGLACVGALIGATVMTRSADRALQMCVMLGATMSLFLLLLVREPLLTFCASKVPLMEKLLRWRGYWFDSDTATDIDTYRLQ